MAKADLAIKLNKEEILKHKILLIGITLGLVSLWFGYNKIYKGNLTSVQGLRAQVKDELLKTDVAKRIGALQNELAGYTKYFAKENDILWLIERVSRAAKESNLGMISLNPHPLVPKKSLLYGKVDISVKGTYHQLGDFVSRMEGSAEFMQVEKLTFKKDNEFINADISVVTYFWKG